MENEYYLCIVASYFMMIYGGYHIVLRHLLLFSKFDWKRKIFCSNLSKREF